MAVHSGKVLWGFTVAPSSHINDVANFNVRYFFSSRLLTDPLLIRTLFRDPPTDPQEDWNIMKF